MKEQGKDEFSEDIGPAHTEGVLRQKVKFLEEELVRKDELIEKLRQENELLFRTAIKNSEARPYK